MREFVCVFTVRSGVSCSGHLCVCVCVCVDDDDDCWSPDVQHKLDKPSLTDVLILISLCSFYSKMLNVCLF